MCLHGNLEHLPFWTETIYIYFYIFALDNWLADVSILHPLDLLTNQTCQWTCRTGRKRSGEIRWHQTTERNLQLLNRQLDSVTLQDWRQTIDKDLQPLNRRLDVVTLQDWPQTIDRDMQLIN